MEFEKAKELFKKNTETMAAYSHAMGVLSYDSETAAPKNSAEGLGRTYGVLSEIIYKLTVNEEQFEVIDTMMSNLDKLDFITRREVEEKARELNQMRKIPMDEYTAFQVLQKPIMHGLKQKIRTIIPFLNRILRKLSNTTEK